MSGRKRTSNERDSQNDGWKVGLLAVGGAALIGGLGYYLGNQNREPNRQCQSYQDNASTGSSAGHQEHSHSREKCSICLGKMKPVRRLACGHTFHSECISQWLPKNATCPICRNAQE